MLYRDPQIIISLLVIINFSFTIGVTLLTKDNDKITENSALQMCIDSFDIHNDKIIRTQDSQGMGAKYLNEADLNSRQDCLRLCCETDDCDVFIFEEKKPGSCYLFHCGPPHDFKCKFTNHANYSSAVLTNIKYRSTTQLEEQIRRTQQEHELKSLRKLPEPALEYSYTEAPPIPATQASKNLALTTPVPMKTRCSRNQYECRTSGDCIAIYNVCDGIPQCTDGSDEASELGCPTERPTLPSDPIIHRPLVPQNSQVMKYPAALLPHRKNYPPMYPNEQDNPPKLWQLPVSPHQIIGQQPNNVQYPGPQGVISLPQINYNSQGYMGAWDYRQMYEQNKEAYNTANQIHPKNDPPPYEQDQPRIFKHKSAGVGPQSAGPEGNSYIETNRPYGSYYPLKNHAAWQEGQLQFPSQQPEPVASSSPKLKQSEPVATQEQPKSTAGPLPCKPSSKQIIDPPKETNDEQKGHETPKTIHVDTTNAKDHNAKSVTHESVQQESRPEVKIEKTQDHDEQHKKSHEEHKTEVRRHHYVADHLQQNNHKPDYDALRPKGAVISLALGLTATAIMAALIACRLRVVRRRGRRGHGPYAHDADYLVNGMYL